MNIFLLLVIGVTYLHQRREFHRTGLMSYSVLAFVFGTGLWRKVIYHWLLILWLSQYFSLVYIRDWFFKPFVCLVAP